MSSITDSPIVGHVFGLSAVFLFNFQLQFVCTSILVPVYTTRVRHLHNLRSDHPHKPSTHLTPDKVITILRTVLCLPVTVSISGNLHILIPSPFSPSSQPSSPLATVNLFSVFVSLLVFCLFVYFVFQILHRSEIMALVFLCLIYFI